jgi:hypothetical protein
MSSIFDVYEPKPDLVRAVLVTNDNLIDIATELVERGYEATVHCTREGNWLSITLVDSQPVTVRPMQYLVLDRSVAHVAQAVDYDDFRKAWRTERADN